LRSREGAEPGDAWPASHLAEPEEAAGSANPATTRRWPASAVTQVEGVVEPGKLPLPGDVRPGQEAEASACCVRVEARLPRSVPNRDFLPASRQNRYCCWSRVKDPLFVHLAIIEFRSLSADCRSRFGESRSHFDAHSPVRLYIHCQSRSAPSHTPTSHGPSSTVPPLQQSPRPHPCAVAGHPYVHSMTDPQPTFMRVSE
jgi:hypothetical protein